MHFRENKAALGIMNPCNKLAVGKSSGAAGAELNIGFRVQNAETKKSFYVRRSFLHSGAAFDHNGAVTILGKNQCAEHPARSESDNNRSIGQRLVAETDFHLFICRRNDSVCGERLIVSAVLYLRRNRIDKLDIRLFPRVDRAFMNFHFADCRFRKELQKTLIRAGEHLVL